MDLLTAAVHARAAYGYAMAAGHLSSISKFAMLHTVRARSQALPLPGIALAGLGIGFLWHLCTALVNDNALRWSRHFCQAGRQACR